MRRTRHPLPLVLAAMVITSASAVAQGQRFTVAIVRSEGALVPFAAYDAGRWERAWPEPDEATDINAVDSVPSAWRRRGARVPDVWRVWPSSGAPGITVQVNGVEVVEAHCQRQIALKTDYPAPRPSIRSSSASPSIQRASPSLRSRRSIAQTRSGRQLSELLWRAFRGWKPRRPPEIVDSCP